MRLPKAQLGQVTEGGKALAERKWHSGHAARTAIPWL